MRIFGDKISGNCLKIKWTADALGLPYTWVDVDITKGETRTPAFLAMNPAGQVPFVAFDDGRTLAQSNAVIRYLARGSTLLPSDAFDAAKADEWLFWEQYSHEPYVAVARAQVIFEGKRVDQLDQRLVSRGNAALDLMERTLADGRAWFVAGALSIADIALLAYTRVAHEGGFDLSHRPNLKRWVLRGEEALGLPAAIHAQQQQQQQQQ